MNKKKLQKYFEERVPEGLKFKNPTKMQKVWTNTLLGMCIKCRTLAIQRNKQKIEPVMEEFCEKCQNRLKLALKLTETMTEQS